jgi:hypothetical protein
VDNNRHFKKRARSASSLKKDANAFHRVQALHVTRNSPPWALGSVPVHAGSSPARWH